jgi:hypothetical protein
MLANERTEIIEVYSMQRWKLANESAENIYTLYSMQRWKLANESAENIYTLYSMQRWKLANDEGDLIQAADANWSRREEMKQFLTHQ